MNRTQTGTFSDLARARLKRFLDGAAVFLARLGVTPNMLTFAGFGGHVVAAVLVAMGSFLAAGIALLVLAPLDALDGSLARLEGTPSKRGAFTDSVVDRYSELILFGGFLVYFLDRSDRTMALWVFAAAAGSILVSYTRARGEALGFEVRKGLLTRFERYLVIIPTLIVGRPNYGIIVIAIFANFTALQRFLHVWRQAEQQEAP